MLLNLKGSLSLTHGITVNATAGGLRGTRKRGDRRGDKCARVGKREELLGDWISVETAGTCRPQGFPLKDTETYGGAGYHTYQNHLETLTKMQVTGPRPRNRNLSSRGVTKLPHP